METPHYPETPAAHESDCVMSAAGRLSVPLQYHIWPLGETGLLFVGCWDRFHGNCSFVLGRPPPSSTRREGWASLANGVVEKSYRQF